MAPTMTKEHTLSIIKPDAVAQNQIGNILEYFEREGLSMVAGKMVQLTVEQAKSFYAVHAKRPFFTELVEFMVSGPIFVMVLEGENAVLRTREIMGATDPTQAAPRTIRADFASSIDRNAVHGSDTSENAQKEIAFFFKLSEIFPRN
jgi:nucleoside-diphosphate kinase